MCIKNECFWPIIMWTFLCKSVSWWCDIWVCLDFELFLFFQLCLSSNLEIHTRNRRIGKEDSKKLIKGIEYCYNFSILSNWCLKVFWNFKRCNRKKVTTNTIKHKSSLNVFKLHLFVFKHVCSFVLWTSLFF